MAEPMDGVQQTQSAHSDRDSGMGVAPPGSAIAGTTEVMVPAEQQGIPDNLQVDAERWEEDSALGSDQYTITTSIASSSKDFRHEGGRRYHAFDEDAYFLPNDEIEAGRLDLQHHTWKLTFDGALSLVPITENMRRVLDVGTGTGIWAMEVAETHPHIEVIGTDLSPIQPDFIPPNCQFIVDNAEYDWAFDQKFHFVHSRMLTLGVHDWKRYFQQCWDNLEPGGWIETGETTFPQHRADHEPAQDSPLIRWGRNVIEATSRAGLDVQASLHFTELLEAQGFVNIERINVQWPMRPWAKGKKNKAIGRLLYENTTKAIAGIGGLLFMKHLGWTKEQIDQTTAEVIEDIDKNHFYALMVCHKAQKPYDAV